MDQNEKLSRSYDLAAKVATLFQKRTKIAQEKFSERVRKACSDHAAELMAKPLAPWDFWKNCYRYSVDFAQRSVLLRDTLRQRGNTFLEHNKQGLPQRQQSDRVTQWPM